jgi:hypothetical protein
LQMMYSLEEFQLPHNLSLCLYHTFSSSVLTLVITCCRCMCLHLSARHRRWRMFKRRTPIGCKQSDTV